MVHLVSALSIGNVQGFSKVAVCASITTLMFLLLFINAYKMAVSGQNMGGLWHIITQLLGFLDANRESVLQKRKGYFMGA
jgi:hypothetical protein